MKETRFKFITESENIIINGYNNLTDQQFYRQPFNSVNGEPFTDITEAKEFVKLNFQMDQDIKLEDDNTIIFTEKEIIEEINE